MFWETFFFCDRVTFWKSRKNQMKKNRGRLFVNLENGGFRTPNCKHKRKKKYRLWAFWVFDPNFQRLEVVTCFTVRFARIVHDRGDQAVWVFGLKKSPIVVECGSKMLHGTGIFTTRWFKVPFSSPSWRSLNPLKGSLNHPKKVTLNHQVFFIFTPIWGNDPIWRPHIFQRGWFNHRLVYLHLA